MQFKDKINLFFSCDDNYLPLLSVTLTSIKENRNAKREYNVTVLNTGLREDYKRRITEELASDGFDISFRDISPLVESISERLHTRDYYSSTTYYRLFIPNLYPELDKALYLDCDLAVTGDISGLYDVELGERLVAAVPDGFVNSEPVLRLYSENRIGKDAGRYFNAGVLLMNLAELRKFDFEEKFVRLLSSVKFAVAQDQDYLNVLCNGRELILDGCWNCMPNFELTRKAPLIVHFNLHNKPWQKSGVPFEDIFDEYAKKSCFINEIREIYANYKAEMILKAERQTEALLDMAYREATDEQTCKQAERAVSEILCTEV